MLSARITPPREPQPSMIDVYKRQDEMMQKLLQHFMDITEDNMPKDAHEMSKGFVPYVEVDLKDTWEEILYSLMSGVFLLFVDGFDKCILIDSRTYPARGAEAVSYTHIGSRLSYFCNMPFSGRR